MLSGQPRLLWAGPAAARIGQEFVLCAGGHVCLCGEQCMFATAALHVRVLLFGVVVLTAQACCLLAWPGVHACMLDFMFPWHQHSCVWSCVLPEQQPHPQGSPLPESLFSRLCLLQYFYAGDWPCLLVGTPCSRVSWLSCNGCSAQLCTLASVSPQQSWEGEETFGSSKGHHRRNSHTCMWWPYPALCRFTQRTIRTPAGVAVVV